MRQLLGTHRTPTGLAAGHSGWFGDDATLAGRHAWIALMYNHSKRMVGQGITFDIHRSIMHLISQLVRVCWYSDQGTKWNKTAMDHPVKYHTINLLRQGTKVASVWHRLQRPASGRGWPTPQAYE